MKNSKNVTSLYYLGVKYQHPNTNCIRISIEDMFDINMMINNIMNNNT